MTLSGLKQYNCSKLVFRWNNLTKKCYDWQKWAILNNIGTRSSWKHENKLKE